ncbi:MAG: cytochrome c [Anaerolineae bacterium]|nr:cytochrome c [Anaerolineae bacterium]
MRLDRLAACLLAGLLLMGCSGLTLWAHLLGPEPTESTRVGDPARGAEIFTHNQNEAPPCTTCHQVVKGGYGFSLGPNLENIADRAGSRIEGFSAEQYLEDSILQPAHYVVSGFHVSMYTEYAERLSAQDVADLVAYLMTL